MARKKKSDGIDLTAKTTKKEPAWKQLGYTPEYSPSGNRKGFRDKEGNYIPERQFRRMVGTPMKGSQGYKERQAAKAEGKNFRPMTEKQIEKEMKKAAKTPGMTLEEFMTGKSRELAYTNRRIQSKHNEFLDKQRRDAIEFKKRAGVLTEKQAATAHKDLQKQIDAREKAIKLREQLDNPLDRKKRERLEKEYRKQADIIRKQQEKLEKKGLVIIDDKPSQESLRYGYYH